jgi:hypothetical protein
MIVPYLTAAGGTGRFTTDARILLAGIAVKLDAAEADLNRVAQRRLGGAVWSLRERPVRARCGRW